MANNTTISITRETRNRLAALCTKDQNFEEIIQELLKKWKKEH